MFQIIDAQGELFKVVVQWGKYNNNNNIFIVVVAVGTISQSIFNFAPVQP